MLGSGLYAPCSFLQFYKNLKITIGCIEDGLSTVGIKQCDSVGGSDAVQISLR